MKTNIALDLVIALTVVVAAVLYRLLAFLQPGWVPMVLFLGATVLLLGIILSDLVRGLHDNQTD